MYINITLGSIRTFLEAIEGVAKLSKTDDLKDRTN